MTRIVLASNNQGKIDELNALFANTPYKVIGQGEAGVQGEAVEDGLTFVENALIKARFATEHTGRWAIADDSGLCIPELNGEPGLYSSRYSLKAGELPNTNRSIVDKANNAKVLEKLHDSTDRQAYFICVIVFLRHVNDPDPIICRGIWNGHITQSPSGQDGFGYDPIFIGKGMSITAAELTKQQKNTVSHRGQSVNLLKSLLASELKRSS